MSFSQFVRNGYDSETKHTCKTLVVKTNGKMFLKTKKIPELPYELLEMIFNLYEKSELRALCDRFMPRVLGFFNQDEDKAEWRANKVLYSWGRDEAECDKRYEKHFCQGSKFLRSKQTNMPLNWVMAEDNCNKSTRPVTAQEVARLAVMGGTLRTPMSQDIKGAEPAIKTKHAILTMKTVGGMLCRPYTLEALNSKGQSIPLYKMYGKSGDRYLQINRAQKMFYKKVTVVMNIPD